MRYPQRRTTGPHKRTSGEDQAFAQGYGSAGSGLYNGAYTDFAAVIDRRYSKADAV